MENLLLVSTCLNVLLCSNKRKLYTCSIDGTFASRVFREGSGSQDHLIKTFLDTGVDCYNQWYTAFDISPVDKTMLAGNNLGQMTLMTDNGEKLWQQKLHKSKVGGKRFQGTVDDIIQWK